MSKPPIAISFSSMPLKNPEHIRKMLAEALKETGQRGIMIAGWSGMNNVDSQPHIFAVDSIPHTWLRRMKEIGVAAAPLKEKDMSVESFVSRIHELLTNDSLMTNASVFAKQIAKETGVEDTVKFIEEKLRIT